MSDHAAFLRAIIAEPDDDVPRLVFADWLDEHGQPERSEFIRVQVELAACWLCRGQPETQWRRCGSCRALRRRERKLLEAHGRDWSPSRGFVRGRRHGWRLAKSGPTVEWSDRTSVTFTRGFVSSVTLSWADWQAHAADLLAACPLRRVNRPRACGACAGKGGASQTIVTGGAYYHTGTCPACRGTGTVDDWRGDGVVRLTDWPDFYVTETADGALVMQLLEGGQFVPLPADAADRVRHVPLGLMGPEGRRELVPDLLAAEWPGVRFELPAAQRWYDADEVAAMISRAEGDEALTGGRP